MAPVIMHNAVIHATTLKSQCWAYHEHAPNTEHMLQYTQVYHLSGLPVPPIYSYILQLLIHTLIIVSTLTLQSQIPSKQ